MNKFNLRSLINFFSEFCSPLSFRVVAKISCPTMVLINITKSILFDWNVRYSSYAVVAWVLVNIDENITYQLKWTDWKLLVRVFVTVSGVKTYILLDLCDYCNFRFSYYKKSLWHPFLVRLKILFLGSGITESTN